MIKRAILCVDDEKIVLDSIRNEIKSSICCDITVEVAQSAEEAIEIFNELIHDGYDIPLVISDYIMPEMKGDEFLKLINIISSSTYKILLTGQATIEGVTNAINYANLYRYIGKPWEKHDFSMTINEAIKSYEKDIELEKRRRDLIEANEKLIKLDSAKSYFLGLLSHELRTPLMGISGNAQYISEITQDAEIRECVNSIMLSESRLRRFAELSLLITQIKTDKYDTTFYDESVNQIMVNVLNNFQACIKLKNLTVENKLAKEFFTARLDLALISKVFTIIVENAIKFTPNDSKIIISSEKQGKHLVMSVEDQGTGFSTDSLKNAFSMFISTEDLMHHSEGTGLSLAAAKVIFDLHNFGIKVTNSESGSGKVIMTF